MSINKSLPSIKESRNKVYVEEQLLCHDDGVGRLEQNKTSQCKNLDMSREREDAGNENFSSDQLFRDDNSLFKARIIHQHQLVPHQLYFWVGC